MNFDEAVAEYQKGKKIKRKEMNCYLDKNLIENKELFFHLFFNDIVANDWEVIE